MNAPSPAGMGRPERSNCIEKVVEYRFLADLTAELLRRDLDFEVLRGDVDAYGYDLVIEVGALSRHIQLKSAYKGAKTKSQSVSVLLSAKPSGCLVWITYDPKTFNLVSFRFLGGLPGEPFLLAADAPVALSTRYNKDGVRTSRPNHRKAKRESMKLVTEISDLADLLFGAAQ